MITLERYIGLRAALLELGHGREYAWAQSVGPPACAEDLALEYSWVVINSGMRNTVAEKIWARVRPALERGGRVGSTFGHPGKRAAIDAMWAGRARRLEEFRRFGLTGIAACDGAGADAVIAWCESLPWIGGITKYHLAKSLGVDCAKPDRWLVRLALAEGATVDGLCARLALASGDRVATVDVVLWRACAIGILVPGADPPCDTLPGPR